MCGIFGYFGPRERPTEMVIEGLKKLEYRGYDSWGVAYKTQDDIVIHKQIGKIGEHTDEKAAGISALSSEGATIGEVENADEHIAIGHSRWATPPYSRLCPSSAR